MTLLCFRHLHGTRQIATFLLLTVVLGLAAGCQPKQAVAPQQQVQTAQPDVPVIPGANKSVGVTPLDSSHAIAPTFALRQLPPMRRADSGSAPAPYGVYDIRSGHGKGAWRPTPKPDRT